MAYLTYSGSRLMQRRKAKVFDNRNPSGCLVHSSPIKLVHAKIRVEMVLEAGIYKPVLISEPS